MESNSQITLGFISELKARIVANGARLAKSRTDSDCRLHNDMCRELYSITSEVFSLGQFVKVA
ncbi:MAG TPA: hypothetical protein VMT67_13845 [Terriglobales bacterium]|nr:hypothetical protein [Terriglobales bacterium]